MQRVLKSIKRFESHSLQQNIIFQHYYQSCCDYLLKMCCMDDPQAVIEQLTLNDFKKWSSTALKTFNNYTVIIIKNSDKIRVWCFCICCLFVSKLKMFLWWISWCFKAFPWSWKTHFEHFEWRNNCISLALWDLFYLKPYRAFRIAQRKQPRLVKPCLNSDLYFILETYNTA